MVRARVRVSLTLVHHLPVALNVGDEGYVRRDGPVAFRDQLDRLAEEVGEAHPHEQEEGQQQGAEEGQAEPDSEASPLHAPLLPIRFVACFPLREGACSVLARLFDCVLRPFAIQSAVAAADPPSLALATEPCDRTIVGLANIEDRCASMLGDMFGDIVHQPDASVCRGEQASQFDTYGHFRRQRTIAPQPVGQDELLIPRCAVAQTVFEAHAPSGA
eukprot:scaffold44914_cov77-Phaeocystis_antarctica.AAC.4